MAQTKFTRRQLAGALVAAQAASAQAPTPTPSDSPVELLTLAKLSVVRNRETLAKFKIEQSLEPAARFEAF